MDNNTNADIQQYNQRVTNHRVQQQRNWNQEYFQRQDPRLLQPRNDNEVQFNNLDDFGVYKYSGMSSYNIDVTSDPQMNSRVTTYITIYGETLFTWGSSELLIHAMRNNIGFNNTSFGFDTNDPTFKVENLTPDEKQRVESYNQVR